MDLQSNRDLAELLRKIGVRDTTKLRLQDTEMPVVMTGDTIQQAKPVLPAKAFVGAEVPAGGAGIFGGIVVTAHVDIMVDFVAATLNAWLIPDQTSGLAFTIGAAAHVTPIGDPSIAIQSVGNLATSAADPAGLVGGIPTGANQTGIYQFPYGIFIPSGGKIWLFQVSSNVAINLAIGWREPK